MNPRCFCSQEAGEKLLAVESMLRELLDKKARLQRLLRAQDTRDMLMFFRDNGVLHESGKAIQKLLEQEALLKGNEELSKSGTGIAVVTA